MRDYSFGNFLRALRERQGLSQYQLGLLVGVSDKAVSKWENGSAKPHSRLLFQLSDVLGVTVDELLACKFRSTEESNAKVVFTMKDQLWKKAHQALRDRYGEEAPVEVLNRYLSEFAELKNTDMIVYFDLISQIAAMANENREHIRVREAIGASFVAFVMGATEVNPLKPHYYCPSCRKIEFSNIASCGWDLPVKQCSCGKEYLRDGHNLPFETLRWFIGRNDLLMEISASKSFYNTVREKILAFFDRNTIIPLVSKERSYFEKLVIVNENVSEFTNRQERSYEEYDNRLRHYPAILLTIDEELDDFRLLEERTSTRFADTDFLCSDMREAFRQNHTDGIPGFSSDFLRDMIAGLSLASFGDLIQIAGLAHGTGVWIDNAQQLTAKGIPVGKVISYRDDVFHYVQNRVETKKISGTGYAYKIMEDTRRGIYARGGVSAEMKQHFSTLGVEEWFGESIAKIRYLFPKAFGVQYIKSILILMWYKLNFPEAFKEIILRKRRKD